MVDTVQDIEESDNAEEESGESITTDSKDKKTGKGNTKEDDRSVVIGNYQIHPDSPLPKYNIGETRAYRVSETTETSQSYFALVCEPQHIPRIKDIETYKGIINPQLPRFCISGVVYWPPSRQKQYVFIYVDNLGSPLISQNTKSIAMGWRQDDVIKGILKPLVNILLDFRDKDFSHGNIWPGQIFVPKDKPDGAPQKIMVSDCLSIPHYSALPSLFLPPYLAMTSPLGRGRRTIADDIYALGVTVVCMLRHKDPYIDMTPDHVIREKIEHGSYASITGNERFTGAILEFLRGTLHDNTLQRWTIDDILGWIDGRRLTPKQATKPKKAARPIVFNSKKYFILPFLAMDLQNNFNDMQDIIETGELEQWLKRSLEDETKESHVMKAIEDSSNFREKNSSYNEKLAANLSIAMDPNAPVKYKGLSITAEGVGKVLAEAFILEQDTKPFVELIVNNIIVNWISGQESSYIDRGSLISKLETCKGYIRQKKIGFGLERCVYYLCPESYCLSPFLKKYIAFTPEDVVLAFEEICQKDPSQNVFIDRHIAAFLSSKDSKTIDSFLFDLEQTENNLHTLAVLKTFSRIQKRYDLPPLNALGKRFIKSLDDILKRFHDKELREDLAKQIRQAGEDGNLIEMAKILDNPLTIEKDFKEFQNAMNHYMELTQENDALEKNMQDKKTFGKATGKEMSAVTSCILSAIIMLLVSFLYLGERTFF